MDITYLGHSSFKIKTKKATVVTDPFDSSIVGFKFSPTEADIVTISHDHKDHNDVSKVTGYKKIINGPGEYEIMDVSMMGFATYHDSKNGEERGKNTIYVFETDGLRIVHLGDLGHALSDDLISEIGDVDVLMIPVGGEYTIGSHEATELVSRIEPYFVIPMHYQVPGINPESFAKISAVEDFIKDSALPVERLPKFSIKKEDIMEDSSTKIIVLEKK